MDVMQSFSQIVTTNKPTRVVYPKLIWRSSILVLTTKCSLLPRRGYHAPRQPSDASTPVSILGVINQSMRLFQERAAHKTEIDRETERI